MATRTLKQIADELLAERFADIDPAQQEAETLNSQAQWSRIGGGLASAISGGNYRPTGDHARSLENQAKQTMAQAAQRTEARGDAMDSARKIQAAELDADPNSPEAQFYQQFWGNTFKDRPEMGELVKGKSSKFIKGLSPSLTKVMEEEYRKQAEKDKHQATLDAEGRANKTWLDRNAITSQQELERARVMAGIKAEADANKPPPTVPAGEASQVGELDAAEKMVDAMFADWQKKVSAPGSSVVGLVPGTAAASYDDNKLAAAQGIGTILEGGKLTDADLHGKYMKLVPDKTDSVERATMKKDQLRRLIQDKRAAKIKGLTQAGYKTQGFTQDAPAQAPAATGPHGPTVDQDGVTYTWNPATGQYE